MLICYNATVYIFRLFLQKRYNTFQSMPITLTSMLSTPLPIRTMILKVLNFSRSSFVRIIVCHMRAPTASFRTWNIRMHAHHVSSSEHYTSNLDQCFKKHVPVQHLSQFRIFKVKLCTLVCCTSTKFRLLNRLKLHGSKNSKFMNTKSKTNAFWLGNMLHFLGSGWGLRKVMVYQSALKVTQRKTVEQTNQALQNEHQHQLQVILTEHDHIYRHQNSLWVHHNLRFTKKNLNCQKIEVIFINMASCLLSSQGTQPTWCQEVNELFQHQDNQTSVLGLWSEAVRVIKIFCSRNTLFLSVKQIHIGRGITVLSNNMLKTHNKKPQTEFVTEITCFQKMCYQMPSLYLSCYFHAYI